MLRWGTRISCSFQTFDYLSHCDYQIDLKTSELRTRLTLFSPLPLFHDVLDGPMREEHDIRQSNVVTHIFVHAVSSWIIIPDQPEIYCWGSLILDPLLMQSKQTEGEGDWRRC